MQIKQFKYYLRKYNSVSSMWEYFYVDNSGLVDVTNTPTELPQAPRGWEGQTLIWERGFEWYGVFTNYSNPLQFVNDGAKILKSVYYNNGIEGNCQLYIEKHTNKVFTWGYEEYYKGDIDFSRFKDMKDYVEVSIMQSGFMAKLRAKESTTNEIPVDTNADVVWVNMDGVYLLAESQFIGIVQPDYSQVLQTTSGINIPYLNQYITDGYANGDIYPKGTGDNWATYSQFYSQVNTGVVSVAMMPQYFISNETSSTSYTIELKGTFSIQAFNNDTTNTVYCRLRSLRYDKGSGTILQNLSLGDGSNILPLTAGSDAINVDTSITLGGGECALIYFFYVNGVTGNVDARITDFNLSATWNNKVKQTFIPALRASTVIEHICNDIDNSVVVVDTPSSDYTGYVLTSGDSLRNLEGSLLKTTFADYYEAHNCMFNSSFYFDNVNNEARFNYKHSAFDTMATVMSLGEVNNISISPLTEEVFSKLVIGYRPYSYDDINGKDEFNIELEFQSPITRVVNEKNLVSPYRADMYGIELTRANLTEQDATDNYTDNDIFWLHIDDSSPAGTIPSGLAGAGQDYYDLYRDSGLTITGLNSPATAFNIDFSPKRRMLAWGYWIRSLMYPNLSPTITYQSSSKSQANNVGMETDDGVTIIAEKVGEMISNLPPTNETTPRYQIFYPLVFTIDVKIPLNIMELMNNPHREFSFTYKGNTYYGWLLQVSDEPTYTPKQTYKLIASTSNNLTDLINGI